MPCASRGDASQRRRHKTPVDIFVVKRSICVPINYPWIPYQVNNCRHYCDWVEDDAIVIVHGKDVTEFGRCDGNEHQTEGEFGQDQERPGYSPKKLTKCLNLYKEILQDLWIQRLFYKDIQEIDMNLPLLLDK